MPYLRGSEDNLKFTEKNNCFELLIFGYQFPAMAYEPYDSNWLIVQLNVSTVKGAWSIAEPCLLTYEVSRLANWFEKIGSGNFEEKECVFLEPVISFLVTESDQMKLLRVRFALEAHPPWAYEQNEYFVEFTLSEVDLLMASKDLRKQLEKYPQGASM